MQRIAAETIALQTIDASLFQNIVDSLQNEELAARWILG